MNNEILKRSSIPKQLRCYKFFEFETYKQISHFIIEKTLLHKRSQYRPEEEMLTLAGNRTSWVLAKTDVMYVLKLLNFKKDIKI